MQGLLILKQLRVRLLILEPEIPKIRLKRQPLWYRRKCHVFFVHFFLNCEMCHFFFFTFFFNN